MGGCSLRPGSGSPSCSLCTCRQQLPSAASLCSHLRRGLLLPRHKQFRKVRQVLFFPILGTLILWWLLRVHVPRRPASQTGGSDLCTTFPELRLNFLSRIFSWLSAPHSVSSSLCVLASLCSGHPFLFVRLSQHQYNSLPEAGPDSPESGTFSGSPCLITAQTVLHGTAPYLMYLFHGTEGRPTCDLSQGPALSQRRVGRVCSVIGGWLGGWMTWPFWAVLCENPSMAAETADATFSCSSAPGSNCRGLSTADSELSLQGSC